MFNLHYAEARRRFQRVVVFSNIVSGECNAFYDYNQDGVIDKLDLMCLRTMSWFEVVLF